MILVVVLVRVVGGGGGGGGGGGEGQMKISKTSEVFSYNLILTAFPVFCNDLLISISICISFASVCATAIITDN